MPPIPMPGLSESPESTPPPAVPSTWWLAALRAQLV